MLKLYINKKWMSTSALWCVVEPLYLLRIDDADEDDGA